MDEVVARLVAERAIRDVLGRYCRGVDRIDLALVRDCYWPDATDDHGAFRGGVDEFVAWIERLLPRYDVTTHSIANVVFDWHPTRDDVVRVETYGLAEHQTIDGPPELNLTIAFRFVDRFERRDDRWRIAERVCTTEWVRRNDPAAALAPDARFPRGGRAGSPDPLDRPFP